MTRQFQSKIPIGHYVLLTVLLSVAICLIWQTISLPRQVTGIAIAAILVMMIVIVERMIHTSYTVTDEGAIIINRGRMHRKRAISLDEIDRIDRINHLRIAGKPLQTSLIIVLRNKEEIAITPKNEEEFIKCIAKRKKK